MFLLKKTFHFEAAHHLPLHDGRCQRNHGHSWVGEVEVQGTSLQWEGPKTGMVIDYGDISQVLIPLVLEFLDHHDLNETTGLPNPTSEELARWIFNKLAGKLKGLVAVTIHETCTCSCRYQPE